jgi:hypothetical protein
MGGIRSASIAVLAVLTAGSLGACSHGPKLPVVGSLGKRSDTSNPANIGVNGYLWRASLDTLSFMPLASADPYGGVIITDWYSNPQTPDEQFKATVYILDTRLRADGLSVTVYKRVRNASGQWADAQTSAQTETDIENAILTKARQLRLSNISGRG